jgi:hypothetical protein
MRLSGALHRNRTTGLPAASFLVSGNAYFMRVTRQNAHETQREGAGERRVLRHAHGMERGASRGQAQGQGNRQVTTFRTSTGSAPQELNGCDEARKLEALLLGERIERVPVTPEWLEQPARHRQGRFRVVHDRDFMGPRR